jgi:Fe-S cluster biogenesis protein NfuA
VERAGAAGTPAVLGDSAALSPVASPVAAAVAAAIERGVAPFVIARGGAVRLVSVNDGVVTLEASGSPGAIVPATARIEALLRGAVPGVAEVRVAWPEAEPTPPAESDALAERVRRVLDDEVNPAIAAHRGRVTLVDVMAGRVRIRLEGGCQGCSLAEVTVRQGIESILRRRLPEVVTIVDVTDHDAGTEPFFAPGKR